MSRISRNTKNFIVLLLLACFTIVLFDSCSSSKTYTGKCKGWDQKTMFRKKVN